MSYTKTSIRDAADHAPEFGIGDNLEARFMREALGAETIGMAHYAVKPGKRLGFGHRHGQMEEIYVVTGGSGRFKLGDDVVDVAEGDALRVAPATWREWEAADDGLELIAFGTHVEDDSEMDREFWA